MDDNGFSYNSSSQDFTSHVFGPLSQLERKILDKE